MKKDISNTTKQGKFMPIIDFIVTNKTLVIVLLGLIIAAILSLILRPIISFFIISILILSLLSYLSIKYSRLFISLFLIYLGSLIPNLVLLLAPNFYLEIINNNNNEFTFIYSTSFFLLGLIFLVVSSIRAIKHKKYNNLLLNVIFVIVGILFVGLFNNLYTFKIGGITELVSNVIKNKYYWLEIVLIVLYFKLYLLLNYNIRNNQDLKMDNN